jgi:hypothetical protein
MEIPSYILMPAIMLGAYHGAKAWSYFRNAGSFDAMVRSGQITEEECARCKRDAKLFVAYPIGLDFRKLARVMQSYDLK